MSATTPFLNSANFGNDVAAAAAAAQPGGGTVVLDPGTYTIAVDTTIAPNVTLVAPQGAMLDINAGVTLTIAGGLLADRYAIFSGAGSVSFGAAGATLLTAVFPEWFGSGALQTALYAAAGSRIPLVLANTVYDTGTAGLTVTQNYACILGLASPVGTPSSIPVDEQCAVISYSGPGTAIEVGQNIGGDTWTNNTRFENFRVVCSNVAANAIDFWQVGGVRIEGVTAYNSATAGTTTGIGIRFRGAIDTEVAFVDINNFAIGIQVTLGTGNGPSTTVTVRKCYLHYCNIGFSNIGSWAELLDTILESNRQYGLQTLAQSARTTVTTGWLESNLRHAYTDNQSYAYFNDCVFVSYLNQPFFFDVLQAGQMHFANCRFMGPDGGILFNPAAGITSGAQISFYAPAFNIPPGEPLYIGDGTFPSPALGGAFHAPFFSMTRTRYEFVNNVPVTPGSSALMRCGASPNTSYLM